MTPKFLSRIGNLGGLYAKAKAGWAKKFFAPNFLLDI